MDNSNNLLRDRTSMVRVWKRAYTAGNNAKKRGYAGAFPYCNKCRLHHEGPCRVKCGNYKRVGHLTRDCRATVAATAQRAPVGNQTGNVCYECGRLGHYRNDYPKLRNQNRRNKTGNRAGNNEVKANAYIIGGGGAGPESNVITAELGSFDVIIGMDWLAKYHAVIVYDKKIARVPYGNEVLVIKGDGCNGGSKSRLNIILCTKSQNFQLSRVHSTFYVSNLKKCLSDEPIAIPLDEIHIDEKLNFIEEPVEIMEREVKRLKQSRIPIVKVR
ncbi:putative reverse transcriptase domain-containing protein [Tanacetum coccineum]